MTDLASLKFFVTPPHRCSYLPRQDATTLFADPHQPLDHESYERLSEMGFRRSGNYLYRPRCESCNACIPVRLKVADFKPSKRHKRIIKKNSDLKVNLIEPKFNPVHYRLYEQYINAKHADGDMYPPSPEQYENFLISSWSNTQFAEFQLNDQIIAIAVLDELSSAVSAVYTFYDPSLDKRSLGVYAVLWQITHTQSTGRDYLYLGYLINECKKMSYKKEYQPLEHFIVDAWIEQNDQT